MCTWLILKRNRQRHFCHDIHLHAAADLFDYAECFIISDANMLMKAQRNIILNQGCINLRTRTKNNTSLIPRLCSSAISAINILVAALVEGPRMPGASDFLIFSVTGLIRAAARSVVCIGCFDFFGFFAMIYLPLIRRQSNRTAIASTPMMAYR